MRLDIFLALVLIQIFSNLFAQLPCPGTAIVKFRLGTDAKVVHTVYLKERGIGIIDSIDTRDSGYFCLPNTTFPLFSLTLKNKPFSFKTFLAEEEGVIKIRFDSSFRSDRILMDAGFRNNAFDQANQSFQKNRLSYFNELNNAPRYAHELVPIHQKHQRRIFQQILFYFNFDPVVGYALLSNQRTLLRFLDLDFDLVQELREKIKVIAGETLRDHPAVVEVDKILTSLVEAQISAPLLDFSIPTYENDTVGTEDYRGRFLLLNFWATWSESSLKRNAELDAMYVKFLVQHLDVLGIQLDYKEEPYHIQFIENGLDQKYSWKDGILFKSEKSDQVIEFYGADTVPSNILISPLGEILLVDPSSTKEIEEAIAAYEEAQLN